MNNLFNHMDNDALISRIDKLSLECQPLWGKMNVSQMLAHCQQPLKVGFGELKLKRSLAGILLGSWAKKKFMSNKGFGKNLPTDKAFIVTDSRNFKEEKTKLISLIKRYTTAGPKGLSADTHPFFGKMTPDEWGLLSWKHLDHHLTQYGV